MSHDIIDNRDERLVDHIRRILPGSQAAKFAVGYFFLSGLEAVADVLENVAELRLLIGNTTSRQTIEQIAEGYRRLEPVVEAVEEGQYPKRMEMDQRVRETARQVGSTVAAMDQTGQAEALVGTLVRLITEGRLHVRVYTKGRLHAKAYIFDYGTVYDAQGEPLPRQERGIAIVGSSNFTLGGIAHNTELNVLVHGNNNHAALTKWFEHLWDEAQDFDRHLMEELRRSWPLAEVTPYDIYLKTLYELVHERLEEEDDGAFLWQTEITAVLTDFQYNAVRRAVQMIRQYGGCFVADVVGLGKSYIGAAIVKHFERTEHARPLIICPAPLVEMWEHYNEAYYLNARVLSMGLLREGDDERNILLEDERYRDRNFVLVDESHNFRHPNTQRYRVLQAFLQDGDRRCVLLTATPRNKSAMDVYYQIRLFHPGDKTFLPIDPPDLRQYFKLVEQGERPLPALLSNILIRRTRHEILRWYGFDAETHRRVDSDDFEPYRQGRRRAYVEVGGQPHFFPHRRLKTIEYSIEATYRGLYEQLRSYLGRPRMPDTSQAPDSSPSLTYARYGLGHYVRPEKQRRPPYNDLQRAGINLRGLMRVSLFKRFESSVYAFRCTLERMITSHRAFLQALDQGIVPAGEEARDILYESDRYDEQDLYDALAAVSGRYRVEDFRVDALRVDVENDVALMEQMLELVAPITPSEDTKLQTLLAWLYTGGGGYGPLAEGKCLIFTQYADTARYLYENLNPTGDPRLEVIYSQEKSKAQIVGRFAPRANPEQRPKGDVPEIDLLIATDVLSEGLNLQDCDRVINYDLHWNPVRLIQRFGRIDRIGSVHDEIHGFNFLPETELERNLGLQEKLHRRIQEIHDTIGEDAAILDPSEQLNEEAFYSIYREESVDRFEEGDEEALVDLNEAEEILRQLKEDDPGTFERIAALRDGVRCGRLVAQEGAIVLCRAGRYRQLYLVNEAGEVLSRDVPTVLGLLKCAPDTPAAPLPAGHNERAMAIRRQFAAEVQARQAEQAHTVARSQGQRYLVRELRLLLSEIEDSDRQAQIHALEAAFRAPVSEAVRRRLNALRRKRVTGDELLTVLERLYHRHNLREATARRTSRPAIDETPLIVCSEGLTGAESVP
jgi:superfamily II DNA or RNA helicase